jgi:hypothetical protein
MCQRQRVTCFVLKAQILLELIGTTSLSRGNLIGNLHQHFPEIASRILASTLTKKHRQNLQYS